MNHTMLQVFEWNLPAGGDHFQFLKEQAEALKSSGFDALWLPPVCKATSVYDPGYGIYDLYDLGEFDQKGTIPTKYGDKSQLLDMIKHVQGLGFSVYADVVLNHKASADEEEVFMAQKVDPSNRLITLEEPREIRAWTRFTFPGRAGKYSDFIWNFNHFNGVDYNSLTGERAIFKIMGENKDWSHSVSAEQGNFDYLMFANIDHAHPEVREDIFRWVNWFIETTGVQGFRFDAMKHIDTAFLDDLMRKLGSRENFYLFGEYWVYDPSETDQFLAALHYQADIFDVALHYHFKQAAEQGEHYDLRAIFDNTLVLRHPTMAVTFVDNHDTQPGSSLESFVDDWFKPLAYSLILLRRDGYPCVFFGDYYGLQEPHPHEGHRTVLDTLLRLRRDYAYGDQRDFFEEKNCIGWVRYGNEEHPGSMAVVLSNGEEGRLSLFVGDDQAGKRYIDQTGSWQEEVVIDENGWGDFPVYARNLSCWTAK